MIIYTFEEWAAFEDLEESFEKDCARTAWRARDAEVESLETEIKGLKYRLYKCHNLVCTPGNCRLDGHNCSMQPDYQP